MDFISSLCARPLALGRFKVEVVVHKKVKKVFTDIRSNIEPFIAHLVSFTCKHGWGAVQPFFKYLYHFLLYTVSVSVFLFRVEQIFSVFNYNPNDCP